MGTNMGQNDLNLCSPERKIVSNAIDLCRSQILRSTQYQNFTFVLIFFSLSRLRKPSNIEIKLEEKNKFCRVNIPIHL
jgi:hypothetical protein